ncbi:hypothetical protein H4582DRAFT_2085187 [Lactarius indigo]|nr:hypothetical protein H4582DRAFT_2085187 [Lactarius indigo]
MSTNGELSVQRASRRDVEKWLKDRMITLSEKSASLENVVNVISKAGYDTAYYYKLTHVRALDPPSQVTVSLCDMVATALSYSTIFDIDALLKLDAVLTAQA